VCERESICVCGVFVRAKESECMRVCACLHHHLSCTATEIIATRNLLSNA